MISTGTRRGRVCPDLHWAISSAQTLPPEIERRDWQRQMWRVPHVARVSRCAYSGKAVCVYAKQSSQSLRRYTRQARQAARHPPTWRRTGPARSARSLRAATPLPASGRETLSLHPSGRSPIACFPLSPRRAGCDNLAAERTKPPRKRQPHPRRKVKRGFPTPTNSHLVQPRLTKSREFSGGPMRGNSRIEGTRPVRSGLPPPPSSPPISTGRRRGRVFRPVSGGFAGVGAPRDARDVRIAPHYRSRSRLSISGGSVCADGFLVGVPFTLQWPPMAVCEALDGQRTVIPRLCRISSASGVVGFQSIATQMEGETSARRAGPEPCRAEIDS